MSLYHIQRRGFLIALLTMVGVGAILLCYWQGVSTGVLPSPVQSIGGHEPHVPLPPATVAAREPDMAKGRPAPPLAPALPTHPKPPESAPSGVSTPAAPPREADLTPPTPPVSLTPPTPPPHRRTDSSAVPTQEITSMADLQAGEPQPPVPTRADQELAEHWLEHTNARPIVRAQYEMVDVLRLVQLGHGVIVARSNDKAHQRELYLQTKPDAPPLFAPYTQTVADRFAPYSLTLHSSPALAPLTAAFPVYFPGATCEVSFVPDRALATEIFAQVAQASRSVASGLNPSALMVCEGQLTLRGLSPAFDVVEIRSGAKRFFINRSGVKVGSEESAKAGRLTP